MCVGEKKREKNSQKKLRRIKNADRAKAVTDQRRIEGG